MKEGFFGVITILAIVAIIISVYVVTQQRNDFEIYLNLERMPQKYDTILTVNNSYAPTKPTPIALNITDGEYKSGDSVLFFVGTTLYEGNSAFTLKDIEGISVTNLKLNDVLTAKTVSGEKSLVNAGVTSLFLGTTVATATSSFNVVAVDDESNLVRRNTTFKDIEDFSNLHGVTVEQNKFYTLTNYHIDWHLQNLFYFYSSTTNYTTTGAVATPLKTTSTTHTTTIGLGTTYGNTSGVSHKLIKTSDTNWSVDTAELGLTYYSNIHVNLTFSYYADSGDSPTNLSINVGNITSAIASNNDTTSTIGYKFIKNIDSLNVYTGSFSGIINSSVTPIEVTYKFDVNPFIVNYVYTLEIRELI